MGLGDLRGGHKLDQSVTSVSSDRGANPARLFNPFRYADTFRSHGFEVEKLVPFTAPLPFTTGSWLMGTSFWLRARKL